MIRAGVRRVTILAFPPRRMIRSPGLRPSDSGSHVFVFVAIEGAPFFEHAISDPDEPQAV